MKKLNDLNCDFEYELLDKSQPVVDLREQLAVLYSSPFADIRLWELYDPSLIKTGYYKLFYYEQSVLKHIILFQYPANAPKKIFVINKQFKITLQNIENICNILFFEFGKVQQIIFKNIFEPTQKQAHQLIFKKTSNDVIIENLPNTMEAYLKSLGSTVRKSLRNSQNRLDKDNLKYEVSFYEGEKITREQFDTLVKFNRDKMKDMGIISDLNDNESNVLHQYASTSGFGYLCVCTINGQIICGDFFTIIGEHAYMHFGGYDNLYHKYSIGRINLINVTKYLIEEKNIKYQHFLCGDQEYKFMHGGVDHDLYTFWVFKKNNIFYLYKKFMIEFRKKLKNNKIIFDLYSKLGKMKIIKI